MILLRDFWRRKCNGGGCICGCERAGDGNVGAVHRQRGRREQRGPCRAGEAAQCRRLRAGGTGEAVRLAPLRFFGMSAFFLLLAAFRFQEQECDEQFQSSTVLEIGSGDTLQKIAIPVLCLLIKLSVKTLVA